MTGQVFILISTPMTNEGLVQEAAEELKKMGQVSVEVQSYPALFGEWYECPAMKMPDGKMVFGIDGIRMFVEEELSNDRPRTRVG